MTRSGTLRFLAIFALDARTAALGVLREGGRARSQVVACGSVGKRSSAAFRSGTFAFF